MWTFENKKQEKERRDAETKLADETASKCPICRVPFCKLTQDASINTNSVEPRVSNDAS